MPNKLAKQQVRENLQEAQTMGISFDKNTQATIKISKQRNSQTGISSDWQLQTTAVRAQQTTKISVLYRQV